LNENKVALTKRSFIDIYNRHFDDIRRYIYYRSGDEALAADIAQDTFIKLYQMKEVSPTNTKALLYKMANQYFLDQLRKQSSALKYQNHIKFIFKTEPEDHEEHYRELKEHFEYIISNLPESNRVAYMMSRVEGKTYREIGEILGVSERTIEKRISKVIQRLKKELKET
jgi:RNA polymerase sigma-70 factor (ECF subfamily)